MPAPDAALSAAPPAAPHKYEFIDSLRGLAILGVLLVHVARYAGGTLAGRPALAALLGNGARGVQLFFVVSAFTLFLSMNTRHDEERRPTLNFFLRRFFRVAPLYYLAILYYGALVPVHPSARFSLSEYAANLTFTNGLNPYYINHLVPGGWSITVEFFFYAILPWLFLRVRTLSHAVVLLVLAVLLNTACTSLLAHFPLIAEAGVWWNFLFFYFPNQLPVFACGIVLYFLVRAPQRVLPGGTLLLSAYALLASLATDTASAATGWPYLPRHLWFGFGFVLLGWGLSRKASWVLVNPVTRFVGRISFSLYLVHFAVLDVFDRCKPAAVIASGGLLPGLINVGVGFAVVAGVSSALAWVLYHLVEVPGQNMGRHVIARLEGTA